ncbi:MAG TPA: class I SAM-dependent methyltransferase [Polyangiaceae bacterium]|nr:class I SAM-dependent methyltransferase [Polyangiaceae bacterium]
MTLVHVPCPVCDESDFALVYPATISDAREAPELYFSSSRERAGYLSIVRCQRCGLLLQNPRDDAATLARVYGALADRVYDAEDASRTASAEEHLDLVEAYRSERGRLLDVGCASGLFVAAAHGRGWQARGADASRWMVERARERSPGARFDVGTLESLELEPESLDVVTLFDVLEHVDDPRAALARVARWLRPGGLLVLSVPNSGSWMAKLMGRRWVLLLREHLWYFSPETLAALLERSGYELCNTRMKWVSFSLANVAARLGQYPGPVGSLARRVASHPTLRRLTVRFPMGEMDVVARRRAAG